MIVGPVEAAKGEAVRILRHVAELRSDEPKRPLQAIAFREIVEKPLLDDGQPAPNASPSEIYTAALRFWAEATAPRLTLDEWRTLIEDAAEGVPEFRGDAIGFFENLFEGLRLADGTDIWP